MTETKRERPTKYLVLANKEDKSKKIYIADGWQSEYGINYQWAREYTRNDGTKSPGVASITMTDGTVIDPTKYFFNSGERKQTGTTTPNTRTPNEFPSDNMDDGLPF